MVATGYGARGARATGTTPEDTERLEIGIGPSPTVNDYTDTIRQLMQRQLNLARIAKMEAEHPRGRGDQQPAAPASQVG